MESSGMPHGFLKCLCMFVHFSTNPINQCTIKENHQIMHLETSGISSARYFWKMSIEWKFKKNLCLKSLPRVQTCPVGSPKSPPNIVIVRNKKNKYCDGKLLALWRGLSNACFFANFKSLTQHIALRNVCYGMRSKHLFWEATILLNKTEKIFVFTIHCTSPLHVKEDQVLKKSIKIQFPFPNKLESTIRPQ